MRSPGPRPHPAARRRGLRDGRRVPRLAAALAVVAVAAVGLALGAGGDADAAPPAYWPGRDIARRVVSNPAGPGGWTLNGWGAVNAFGGAPALSGAPNWGRWDIGRDLVVTPSGTGGYVLDGWGGIHRLGSAPALSGAPYWARFDIARRLVLNPAGAGGWVLDGWGGVHRLGGAPALTGGPLWRGWDIARDLVVLPSGTGGYVLDGFGGVHRLGDAPALSGGPYWRGFDIARKLVLDPSGAGGYVLDGFGGIHRIGAAPAVSGAPYWAGWDIARDLAVSSDGAAGYVLDGWGAVHRATVAPTNVEAPVLSGGGVDYTTASVSDGVWSGSPATLTYRWQRCGWGGVDCVDIPGATASSYTLGHDDVGRYVRAVVTATNPAGSASAPSAAGYTAAAGPRNVEAPSITGDLVDGATLTADPGVWTGTPTLTPTYRWWRDGSVVGTGATYTLGHDDVGQTLRLGVVMDGPGGYSPEEYAAPTAEVAPAAPVNTAIPTNSGDLTDGQILTADPGTWTGTPAINFTYQWQRYDADAEGWVDIAGATDVTYDLVPADIDTTVRVKVSATNAAGTTVAYSDATDVIAAAAPHNEVLPYIGGVDPADGDTLSVNPGAWSGSPATFTYQWQRYDAGEWVDIDGATAASYTLGHDDVGQTIHVVVTATNSAASVSETSLPTVPIAAAPPVNTFAPSISGDLVDGATLTADPGTWTGTPDLEVTGYQWYRVDGEDVVEIGTDSSTYTLDHADVGHEVLVAVTMTGPGGTATAESDPTAEVVPAETANLTPPTVSGDATDYGTLTADVGTWAGTPDLVPSYQWKRWGGESSTDIGTDSDTYTLGHDDVGRQITVTVTMTGPGGSATATSAPTVEVAPAAPANTADPSISGVTTDGQTLSADPGTWTGTPTITFTYQWQRCDNAGTNCVDIADEDASDDATYTLSAADAGATVRVLVTADNAAASPVTVVSAASDVIAYAPVANDAPPTIAGDFTDGETVSASSWGDWVGTAPIDLSGEWWRCDTAGDNCDAIDGATADTYTLTSDDVGHTILFVVTADNGASQPLTVSSVPSDVVAAIPTAPAVSPVISGDAIDGQTLATTDGVWTGSAPIELTYKWWRCPAAEWDNCATIPGATENTYTLTPADVGTFLSAQVLASGPGGDSADSSAFSAQVAPLGVAPVDAPSITGNLVDGETLTADPGVWTGTPPITFSYQWYRWAAGVPTAVGTDSPTYTLGPDDIGGTFTVEVTADNTAASPVTVPAAETDVVIPAAPENTLIPTTSGTLRDGETLSADPGTWTGTPTITFTYQWQRYDADAAAWADIDGATADTYTLGPDDVDRMVRVAVTADNAAASPVTVPSAATDVIAAIAPTNDAPPAVGGTTTDGQTLFITVGIWSGSPATYTYQWQRCDNAGANCADIAGAIAATYALKPADIGATVRVAVTATNSAGAATAYSSATAVVAAAPPVIQTIPVISGTPTDGQTLSTTNGTWAGSPATYTYQWVSCVGDPCTDISGATGSTYTLTSAEVGHPVGVRVTATNSAGAAYAWSAGTPAIAAAAPVNTVAPTVSGSAVDGQNLSAGTGTWTGTTPITVAFQWQRCDNAGANCVAIVGATTGSYTLTSADVAATVRVKVTADNAAPGSVDAYSAATALIAAVAPSHQGAPVISGTASVGETLTTTDGTWSGTAPIAYSYQWRRCDSEGSGCVDITGATANSYTLVYGDEGSTFRVRVRATNPANIPVDAYSAATGVVDVTAPAAGATPPSISGSMVEGQTLSVSTGTWTGSPATGYTYDWYRYCYNLGWGPATPVGTAATYVLSAADIGCRIGVFVTATNPAGSDAAAVAGMPNFNDPPGAPAVLPAPPVFTVDPGLNGASDRNEGDTVVGVPGTWTSSAPVTVTYQWKRTLVASPGTWVAIPGATSATYTTQMGDGGYYIRLDVTLTNSGGSVSSYSNVAEIHPV